MELKRITHAENVRLSDSGRAVRILDQSRLPNETVYLELSQAEDLYEAIASLRVRGAPAIGIFAGYALYVLALQSQETQYGPFLEACRRNRDYLNSSRPTAVNLRHMLDRVLAVAESMPCADVPSIQAAMGQAARAIHQEDIAMCTAISEYGLSLVRRETASSPTATPAPWPPPGTAPAWAPCFWPRSGASPFTPGVMKPAPSCKAPV